MLPLHIVGAGAGIGLLEGSEIGMIVLAAASRYRWRRAWLATFAGLATIAPIVLALYAFFTVLPAGITYLAAAAIIFALGVYFLYEGMQRRMGKADKREHIGIGLLGVYTAILIEECEASSIVMSIGAAAHSYTAALLGMAAGLVVPLAAIRSLKGIIDGIPEWALQSAVGTLMVCVSILILALHF